MPPMLAALLMLEMSCSLPIIRAIDLSMEWRKYYDDNYSDEWTDNWFEGQVGIEFDCASRKILGSFLWPFVGTYSDGLWIEPKTYRPDK